MLAVLRPQAALSLLLPRRASLPLLPAPALLLPPHVERELLLDLPPIAPSEFR